MENSEAGKEILHTRGPFEKIDFALDDAQTWTVHAHVGDPQDEQTINRYTKLINDIGLIRDNLRVQQAQIKGNENSSDSKVSAGSDISDLDPQSEPVYSLEPSLEGSYYGELADIHQIFDMPSRAFSARKYPPGREPLFTPEEWQQEITEKEGVEYVKASKSMPTSVEGLTGTYTVLIPRDQNAPKSKEKPFESYPGKLTFQYNEAIRKQAATEPDLPSRPPNPNVQLRRAPIRVR